MLFIALVAYDWQKKRRKNPLTLADWLGAFDTDGRIAGRHDDIRLAEYAEMLTRIAKHGIVGEARNYVWPYLLQLLKPEWPTNFIDSQLQSLRKGYDQLLGKCEELDFQHQEFCEQHSPGQRSAQSQAGREAHPHQVFAEAQRCIIMDAIRADFPSTRASRIEEASSSSSLSDARESVRQGLSGDDARHMKATQKGAAVRLVNLLCAYALHDPEIGYCQGMGDLALPIVLAIKDESTAFWCFVKLMSSARQNFMHDGAGIKRQLEEVSGLVDTADPALSQKLVRLDCAECYFAYRMILVMMRRELPLPEVMMLWEIMWANQLLEVKRRTAPKPVRSESSSSIRPMEVDRKPPNMLVFVIVAAIIHQRKAILYSCRTSDDVMAIFSIKRKLDLWSLLKGASKLIPPGRRRF